MPTTTVPLTDIPLRRINGEAASLADFSGEVLLVVNVASQCGYTPQYEGLEQLYQRFHDRGFEVLGFPANDFGGQEPGTSAEIQSFCTTRFSVTFPMFEKIAVTGEGTHPLYAALIQAQPEAQGTDPAVREELDGFLRSTGAGSATNPAPGILWNFEKFLLGRQGEVLARFAPNVPPEDPRLIAAIESAL